MRSQQARKWIIGVLALAVLTGCDEIPRVKMPEWGGFGVTPSTDKVDTEEVAPKQEGMSAPLRGELGATVVSLGAAGEPGMWLKTPLVTQTQKGRVYHNGLWLAVTLIPIEGEAGAGSRMSLSAMRALELPLTELTEVRVTAG